MRRPSLTANHRLGAFLCLRQARRDGSVGHATLLARITVAPELLATLLDDDGRDLLGERGLAEGCCQIGTRSCL